MLYPRITSTTRAYDVYWETSIVTVYLIVRYFINDLQMMAANSADRALKRQSCPILTRRAIDQMIQSNQKKAIRFAVRSLGWMEVSEEDLTPERSSRAVNAIIKQLGTEEGEQGGACAIRNRWGNGIDIYMDIDDETLRLIDPNKIKSKVRKESMWGKS